MATVVRHPFGILGAIVLVTSALLTFLGFSTSRSSIVMAQKPVIPLVGIDEPSDSESTQVHRQVAVDAGFEEVVVRSASEMTLRHNVELLDQGLIFLKTTGDYTAKLHKQEVVRGELLDEQTISMKSRYHPFSVYLLWLTGDRGREVVYIDGCHDGKMIARDGGWKARIPAFSLSTASFLTMRDARYPVTLEGLQGLIDIMRGVHLEDLARSNFEPRELNLQGVFAGRHCDVFTTKYKSAAGSPIYRKSVTYIDREWNLPIHSRHFEWSSRGEQLVEVQLDEATLVESYSFTELEFRHTLRDCVFDRANPDYHFG